jgi:formylglycine-generating enzyme required for sulfatase activity
MSSKKRMAAIAITIAALTAGTVGVASAHDAAGKGAAKATAIAELVKAGTITQAQADAIAKKFDEMKAAKDANHAADKAARDAHHAAVKALVASTLGIDGAAIEARLVAGETLGAIAGDKKAALITALVALKTKEIEARVTAGSLTAAQATAMKANLTDHVTKMVDSVKGAKGMGPKDGKGPKGDKGHKDGKGKGKGPRH